jgi:S-(hydroxymethyl)glutathione dehydrogenase/alcohol dehydrogenase
MANKVIMTMGVGDGQAIGAALAVTAKRGRVVITNIHPVFENQVSMNGFDVTSMEKQIVGSLFGSANMRSDIPRLLQLYADGQLKLDELVTRTYPLDQINQGYEDMREARNLRGVLTF